MMRRPPRRCFVVMSMFVHTAFSLSAVCTTTCAGAEPVRWSWQEPQAKVLPTGDLEWAPEPFEFKAGESVRYIDFDVAATTPTTASRSRRPGSITPGIPTPPARRGPARARTPTSSSRAWSIAGELDAHESGTRTTPIILTRDPSWGKGPAVICGSEAVTGWKQGADNTLIPEPEKVWYVDLDWAPRNVWMVGKDGAVTRIALARTPNWKITDPDDIKSEWWTWKNPDKPFDNYTTINGQRRHLAFDKDADQHEQAAGLLPGRHRLDHQGLGDGQPVPGQGPGGGPRERLADVRRAVGRRTVATRSSAAASIYLEDKPQYLDSPGEFWFDKKGEGGRLYLRLPGDQDPNTAHVEVAQAHPHDRQPGHEPRAHPRAHLPLHQRLLEPDRRALLGVAREPRRAARLRAAAGQRHGHRGEPLHLRARPQGRPPQGHGPARTPSTRWW